MATILDQIIAEKREEIRRAKRGTPPERLQEQLAHAPPVRDFFAALDGQGPIRLIAEVKKASPSRGALRTDFEPARIAETYQRHGAACVSVLTDRPHFQGSLADLRRVRAAVELPVLRKDFVVDAYQVAEARAAGADAVLLIAECLEPDALAALHDEVVRYGMTPLVEMFDPDHLPSVLGSGARLVGVNNRNLHTFRTDLDHTLQLRARVPSDRLLVSESGIRSRDDVVRLESAGIRAMLVGETLMVSADIGRAVDALLGH